MAGDGRGHEAGPASDEDQLTHRRGAISDRPRLDDPFLEAWLRAGESLRGWLPFVALGLAWIVTMAVLPSRYPGSQPVAPAAGQIWVDGEPPRGTEVAAPAVSDPTDLASAPARPVMRQPASGHAVAVATEAQAVADEPLVQTGVTRGGFDCEPGVLQIPFSTYAAPCVPEWEGDNGGATFRGVTGTEILVVRRTFPSSTPQTEDDRRKAEARREVRDAFIEYFNRVFELYGRKVVFKDFDANPQANSTEEAQDRGKEAACVDATKAVEELKAFGAVQGGGPFSECAAERTLVIFESAYYYPETWYRKFHPYLWGGVMECERVALQNAEWSGKRLAHRKAKWAGDPTFQAQDRKFGIYVPSNDGYQLCVDMSERELEQKYDSGYAARYNYTLDVSRFADEATRASVQFKAAGVTTVVIACDPYSTILLTQAASAQNYRPEWYQIGTALNDTDAIARLTDQSQTDGHLFGLSQLGATHKVWGPKSEPYQVYKRITDKDIPDEIEGADGVYWGLIRIFNFLQSSGPTLTPETMARGVQALPPAGAPEYAVGYVSWQDGPDGTPGAGDHTGIDDSREVYYDGQAMGPDGKKGTYIETHSGKRFRNGEWAAEEPNFWPDR